MNPVIIVGHGPAGISAAIYLKRAGITPLVIGKDAGALKDYQDPVENYYGFSSPVMGSFLIDSGVQQAKRLGIKVMHDAVLKITLKNDLFVLDTLQTQVQAKTVLLATGKTRKALDVSGFSSFKGKGISLCAMCDGYFYRGKRIAVVGSGRYMQSELSELAHLTDQITIFTDGKPLEVDVNHPVIESPIVRIGGDDRVRFVETQEGVHQIDGVFVAIGAPSSIAFASLLGIATSNGNVDVDEHFMTNIPGLFAAGDIVGGKLQIAKAVYDGMLAADGIRAYLKHKEKAPSGD
ncbi:MAG: hypothetical protein EA375_00475 [Acholeplasmataceae bacterium]|nr:MAG: hypothetical protein EA375_00475 [Acholeplasmataceae bacterium]